MSLVSSANKSRSCVVTRPPGSLYQIDVNKKMPEIYISPRCQQNVKSNLKMCISHLANSIAKDTEESPMKNLTQKVSSLKELEARTKVFFPGQQ